MKDKLMAKLVSGYIMCARSHDLETRPQQKVQEEMKQLKNERLKFEGD